MRILCLYTSFVFLFSSTAFGADAQKPDEFRVYFEQMEKQASTSNPDAQECLGELYASGMGTPRDMNSALKEYSAAADAGNRLARERIGQWYYSSNGADKDVPKAIAIFQELIKENYMPAANDLAFAYAFGLGFSKDEKKAISLHQQAADAGDYEAQMRLGLLYHWGGEGLDKDETKAKLWLEKAASHPIYCLATFGNLAVFIINGYMAPLDPKRNLGPTSTLNIMYTYRDGRAENAYVRKSSGVPEVDQAWLDATKAAKLPPWPSSYQSEDKTLGFIIGGADAGIDHQFVDAVRAAIVAAKFMPKEVLMNGSKGKDFVNVTFDYLDGGVSNATVATSSDDPAEDAAALQAVTSAKYPPAPSNYVHKKIHMSISIEFMHVEPTKPAATSPAPEAASKTSGQSGNLRLSPRAGA